jgi:hypothetical protein
MRNLNEIESFVKAVELKRLTAAAKALKLPKSRRHPIELCGPVPSTALCRGAALQPPVGKPDTQFLQMPISQFCF